MRVWSTDADGFALRVEALPRLAWEAPTDGGAATHVWHAEPLVALMVCLKRRGMPQLIAVTIARFAALPPELWFTGGVDVARHTQFSVKPARGELPTVTAFFHPDRELPVGRLRISAPARVARCRLQHHDPDEDIVWPAMAWYVNLAPVGEEPPEDLGSDDDEEVLVVLRFYNY